MSETRLRLVTRGDDAGSCPSANEATWEACTRGILRNVSLMVPGPAFAGAGALFAGQSEVCVGLHVTLNAEWDGPKWGPVLPASRVPSLVDERGHFLPTPNVLHERGFVLDEIMAEVAAQLARMREYGLTVSYLDEHMGVGWLPGLRERLADFARREGLRDVYDVPFLPHGTGAQGDSLLTNWHSRVQAVVAQTMPADTPNTFVLLTHPGKDAEDMQAFTHAGIAPGQVARERDAERLALIDPQLPVWLESLGVDIVRYDSL